MSARKLELTIYVLAITSICFNLYQIYTNSEKCKATLKTETVIAKVEEPTNKIIESSFSERCHSAVLVNVGTSTRGYIIESYTINEEGLITFVDCASKKTYKASNYLLELGVNQNEDDE